MEFNQEIFNQDVKELYENTYYDEYFDYKSFITGINTKRNKAFGVDKSLLEETDIKYDINNILDLPDGRFSIINHNIEFECLYKKQNSDKLYVFLSGARPSLTCPLPIFKRWSYYKYVDYSVLNIADPMYRKYNNIFCGWYYGNKEESYIDYLVEVIAAVAKKQGIGNDKIVLFSSSAGGYAALHCGCRLSGSTVIVLNAQTDISLYSFSMDFQLKMGIDFKAEDKFNRNKLCENIRDAHQTKFFIMENIKSEEDVRQIENLSKILNTRCKYGMNFISDNIICWLYEADSVHPHNAMDFAPLFWVINTLVEKEFDRKYTESICVFLSELWRERYEVFYSKERTEMLSKRKIISNYVGENEQIQGKVIEKYDEFTILPKDYVWNNKKIDIVLQPNTVYSLYIPKAHNDSCDSEFYTIIIKDVHTGNVPLKHCCKIKENTSIIFSTCEDTSGMELRIYPGVLGKSDNLLLMLKNLTVSILETTSSENVSGISSISQSSFDYKKKFSDAIYDLYENTYCEITNHKNFIKSIEQKRENAFGNDKSLLTFTGIKYNVNAIGELNDGRFSVLCHDIEFECLLRKKKSSKLFVVLSAGIPAFDTPQPRFDRWTYGKQIDGSILNIADPMYKQFKNLYVGWYFGTKDICYLDFLVEVVKAISNKLGIDNENITFLGSSSAGYASLYCGCCVEGSSVIAINPQIVIPKYFKRDVDYLVNTLGLDLSVEDKYGRLDIRSKIKNATNSKFILFENARAYEDMLQISLLAETLGTKVRYGINRLADNILAWVFDAEGEVPHKEQDYPQLFFALQALLQNGTNQKDFDSISIFLNELWHERFSLKFSKDISLRKISRANTKINSVGNGNTIYAHKVLDIPELIIQAKNDIWNRVMLTNKLLPNTVYRLNIKNSILKSGKASSFTILIRDMTLNYPSYITSCSIGKEIAVVFSTSNDTSNQELRLYPGEIYHSNDISILFEHISLSEICFKDDAVNR